MTVSTPAEVTALWYLQMQGGTVFGPSRLATHVAWAEQGRIEPGSKVSNDNRLWKPAEDIHALGLEWMIELTPSNSVGPFHVRAIHEFLDDGSITLSTALHNRRTGERTTVAEKRTQISGTAELDEANARIEASAKEVQKMALDLDRTRADLGEATTSLHTTTEKLHEKALALEKTRAELDGANTSFKSLSVEHNATRTKLETALAELHSASEQLKIATEGLLTKQEELRSAAAELQETRDELHTVQSELKTARSELTASKELLATWRSEVEESRSERARLSAAIEAERAIRQETARAAAEATASYQQAVRSAEDHAKRREARFKQETASLEARIAAIAAQVDQKEQELNATNRQVETLREKLSTSSRTVSERETAIASLRDELERARTEREQHDALYRREQAEGAAFRIAASGRENELKAQVAALSNELSLTTEERDAARRGEASAKDRAAGLENLLSEARNEASKELESARSDRVLVERARIALERQLDATKGDLRVTRDQLQALSTRTSDAEQGRDRMADAVSAANAEVRSMVARVAEMTAAMADLSARHDAARSAEAQAIATVRAIEREKSALTQERDTAVLAASDASKRLAAVLTSNQSKSVTHTHHVSAGDNAGEAQSVTSTHLMDIRQLKESLETERTQAREAVMRVEAERNTLAQRLRERESLNMTRESETERLQSVIQQKDVEISDLDRLVNEYRLQIRTLADRCTNLESAAFQANAAQSSTARGGRRRPMNAANWSSTDSKDAASSSSDHPLAGLEAKVSQELLNWRRSQNATQKRPD